MRWCVTASFIFVLADQNIVMEGLIIMHLEVEIPAGELIRRSVVLFRIGVEIGCVRWTPHLRSAAPIRQIWTADPIKSRYYRIYHWVNGCQQWFIGQTLPIETLEPPGIKFKSISEQLKAFLIINIIELSIHVAYRPFSSNFFSSLWCIIPDWFQTNPNGSSIWNFVLFRQIVENGPSAIDLLIDDLDQTLINIYRWLCIRCKWRERDIKTRSWNTYVFLYHQCRLFGSRGVRWVFRDRGVWWEPALGGWRYVGIRPGRYPSKWCCTSS